MSLTFDMESAGDCLQDFRNKIDQFDNDCMNQSLAMDCAISAWTVVDWVYRCDGKRLGFNKLSTLQDEFRRSCQSLALLQDIANARKHKEIDRYTPVVKSSTVHRGAFDAGFSRDFDISRLVISTSADEFSFFETLEKALAFYEGFFERNKIR